MLELWELGGRDDCRFSTFSWRTRLALHHKGLPFAVHPVAVSDKAAVGFSGQSKVPILKHDGHVIPDSWAIALYLEKEFPERPTLFGGEVGQTLTHVFNVWADRELIPALIPFLMRDVLDCVSEADGAHLRRQIESAMKKSLEELSAGREQAAAGSQSPRGQGLSGRRRADLCGLYLVRTPAMGARRVADESARRWRRGRSVV
jgi:glutathione S-transferase